MAERLADGLYDKPLTALVADQVSALEDGRRAVSSALDAGEAPLLLARLLHDRLVHAFRSLAGDDAVAAQVALANDVLRLLEAQAKRSGAAGDRLSSDARKLLSIASQRHGLAAPTDAVRPSIPLSTSDLLVNGPHDLSLGPEVKRELASADRVDLLCSFLKWTGYRVIASELESFLARRPGGLRVLTTAYMGATERVALDALADLGAEVRISYDTSRTRLHAKAWLFERDSGFSTGLVGSSNLSAAAMLDGLEWNVRLSQVDNGAILDKFRSTFDQYWNDPEFASYDPACDAERFDKAVQRQGRARTHLLLTRFDIEPRPHQQEILDDLQCERDHGHTHNLVVAATGTGKTVIAALDFKRLRAQFGADTSLLFVAHRKEILTQSLATFQVVLRDGVFGELMHGGSKPAVGRHVFAAIQSLHAKRLQSIDPGEYDVVIVDEFHHAAANSYTALLDQLEPKFLLGLTATPERMDGRSVLGWFDGRVASELRLWKALDQQLLCPFQYFGVRGPDLTHVPWSRGKYDEKALYNVYTADHFFAHRVLQELQKKVPDLDTMRALGFCVNIAHAEFMAKRFVERNVAAAAVSSKTPPGERDAALQRLRDGELRVLFNVDLFGEGVDVPDVDTIIMLRPTESATVFLQQLGRGLRRSDGKTCLTVLDFIGAANRKFRFDARYRSIVGGTRRQVLQQIERGFPSLPSGCVIELDRFAQEAVLANVRAGIWGSRRALVEDLSELVRERGEVDLATFLDETGAELEDVYNKPGSCFTELRRAAGLVPHWNEDTRRIERSFSRLLHIDDAVRLGGFRQLLADAEPPVADDSDPVHRALFVLLGYMREPFSGLADLWSLLWKHSPLLAELRQLIDLLDDRVRRLTWPLTGTLGDLPLRVHGTYALDEVMAAVDERTKKGGVKRIQTGVHHLERLRTDLLFVTLEKAAKNYTPTTMYNDYPIAAARFHWETQSNCHVDTNTGQRYLRAIKGSTNRVLMFVRQRRRDARGLTMPYMLLGDCYYRCHRGGRPMQIEWDLARSMPASLYQEVKVAAG